MKTRNRRVSTEKRKFLTLREVREVYGLGWAVVGKLVSERKLFRSRVGNAYFYSVSELDNLFKPQQPKRAGVFK